MSTVYGTLYGVSLGPGDPGWITLAAHSILERCRHWFYPVRGRTHASAALAIATACGLRPPPHARALVLPMTHDETRLRQAWARAAEAIVPVLAQGEDAAFLVEGDASTYATFSYIAAAVQEKLPNAPVTVLPGVTSFAAAAARAGVALTSQDERLAVLPANYGVALLDAVLPHFETLVLMKIKPVLDQLIDWLEAKELLAHAVYAEAIGWPEERFLVGPAIAELRGQTVPYFALLIVRNPNALTPGERVRGCRKKSPPSSSRGEADRPMAMNLSLDTNGINAQHKETPQ